jgi:hypothetical protein
VLRVGVDEFVGLVLQQHGDRFYGRRPGEMSKGGHKCGHLSWQQTVREKHSQSFWNDHKKMEVTQWLCFFDTSAEHFKSIKSCFLFFVTSWHNVHDRVHRLSFEVFEPLNPQERRVFPSWSQVPHSFVNDPPASIMSLTMSPGNINFPMSSENTRWSLAQWCLHITPYGTFLDVVSAFRWKHLTYVLVLSWNNTAQVGDLVRPEGCGLWFGLSPQGHILLIVVASCAFGVRKSAGPSARRLGLLSRTLHLYIGTLVMLLSRRSDNSRSLAVHRIDKCHWSLSD